MYGILRLVAITRSEENKGKTKSVSLGVERGRIGYNVRKVKFDISFFLYIFSHEYKKKIVVILVQNVFFVVSLVQNVAVKLC